jgi:hypothetical protein
MCLSARETVCQIIRLLSAKIREQGYRVKFTIALNQIDGGAYQHDYRFDQHERRSPRSHSMGTRRSDSGSSGVGYPHEILDDNLRTRQGFAIKR